MLSNLAARSSKMTPFAIIATINTAACGKTPQSYIEATERGMLGMPQTGFMSKQIPDVIDTIFDHSGSF